MGKRIRNIYFTADWHIGHANVLSFDRRPFKDLDHMNESLIKRFNATVREEDVCYFLGDMGWSGLKSVMDKLNGTKILILGNHDKKQQSMMNSGFDAAMHSASMYIQGELVTITHCPLRGIKREDTTGMRGCDGTENWHREVNHTQFSIEDQGQFHLHGHIHSPNGGKSEKILGRQMDVGVVAWGYIPVSISTIESWIVKIKKGEKNEQISDYDKSRRVRL